MSKPVKPNYFFHYPYQDVNKAHQGSLAMTIFLVLPAVAFLLLLLLLPSVPDQDYHYFLNVREMVQPRFGSGFSLTEVSAFLGWTERAILFFGTLYLPVLAFWSVFRPSLLGVTSLFALVYGILLFLFRAEIVLAYVPLFFLFMAKQRKPFDVWYLPWLGPFFSTARAKFRAHLGKAERGRLIVFYDGSCGYCNRAVSTCLRMGLPDHVFFATLEGENYRDLKKIAPYVDEVDSMLVWDQGRKRVLMRAAAVSELAAQYRHPLGWCFLFLIIPVPILNIGYRIFAAVRHKIGIRQTCRVFNEQEQAQLLE